MFTNDVESLVKIDTNYNTMIKQLTKDVKLTSSDISSITSTQTSTGNTYSIITTKGTEQNQIDVIYNKDTKEVKILDMETIQQKPAEPAPRTTTTVSKEDYTTNDIPLIVTKSVKDFNVPAFTIEQITKVEKSTTSFGTNYVIEIETTKGKATLIATVTSDKKVNVITYRAPVSQQPVSSVDAPSKTEFTVDVVTGTQVQSTNDVKVIQSSQVVKNTVTELVKSSVISKDS